MIFRLFLLGIILTSCSINTPSEGAKIGRIVKLANEGIFSKTYEGELIRGGITDGSGSFGNSFHFTIEDPQLINIAKDAMEKQHEVVMYYHVEGISSTFRSANMEPHFVIDIQKSSKL